MHSQWTWLKYAEKSGKTVFNSILKAFAVVLTSKMGLFLPKVDLDDFKCLEVAR